jgi:hypothetical protein
MPFVPPNQPAGQYQKADAAAIERVHRELERQRADEEKRRREEAKRRMDADARARASATSQKK